MTCKNKAVSEADVSRCDYYWGAVYEGPAAALIAAGLVLATQLPGQPGIGKRSATFYRGVLVPKGGHRPRDEHYLQVVAIRADRFRVCVHLSDDEQEARRAKQNELSGVRRTQERVDKELRSLPQSHVDFKHRAAVALGVFVSSVVENWMRENESHGYSFSVDAINEFEVAASSLASVLAMATTEFDGARHRACILQRKAMVAKTDGPLQSLIASASAQAVCAAAAAP